MHTSPDTVPVDMELLENITTTYNNISKDKIIILGDLNLACSYSKGQEDGYFQNWVWNIKDTDDTTVANSSCAYDRIITNFQPKDVGIYKNITKDISDHYPVWITI
jgi:endonuclease/exonuclease/phosphatase family metal-dependent hydrolase